MFPFIRLGPDEGWQRLDAVGIPWKSNISLCRSILHSKKFVWIEFGCGHWPNINCRNESSHHHLANCRSNISIDGNLSLFCVGLSFIQFDIWFIRHRWSSSPSTRTPIQLKSYQTSQWNSFDVAYGLRTATVIISRSKINLLKCPEFISNRLLVTLLPAYGQPSRIYSPIESRRNEAKKNQTKAELWWTWPHIARIVRMTGQTAGSFLNQTEINA